MDLHNTRAATAALFRTPERWMDGERLRYHSFGSPPSAMHPGELFRANLAVIDQVIAGVCRRARLGGADAEDFASSVKLALMENDYAILQQYQQRASLATYLAIVVDRLLSDQRTREYGRWRPSTEAVRMGPAAILLETLVRRDRRSLDEALPHVCAVDPALTRQAAEAMLARLPEHKRRPARAELDEAAEQTVAGPDRADADALACDARRLTGRTSAVVKEAIARLPQEDRMLLRFRFGSAMSISDIARMMRLPQRPLYRRFEGLLVKLRAALDAAGLDAREVEELIGSEEGPEMNFGLAENAAVRQSVLHEESQAATRESS